jgi:MoaA/NifB/PqqE/SkfB family radical SAM enzyme
MTLENFKSIIDQLKHHTNQVALGGRGDPNLHPDFEAIVNYARDNGVVPNYTTSGRNLTDEQIEISKVCGAVAVSDYERDFTYNAIDRLINAGIKTNIHLIYSRPNHVKAMHIITGDDVWDGQVNMDKLNALIFLLFKPQGSGAKRLDLIPETHHIQDFARIVFSPKAKFKIGMDSCLINHVLGYSTPNDIQRMAVDTCESGRMSVYISPSMELIPCSFADHSKWGTKIIDKQGINGIWNDSILFKIFRNKLKIAPNECPLGL